MAKSKVVLLFTVKQVINKYWLEVIMNFEEYKRLHNEDRRKVLNIVHVKMIKIGRMIYE